MLLKRGDVVQHNEHKWIGAIESSSKIIRELFDAWAGTIIWFEGTDYLVGDSNNYTEPQLTKLDGYEFEAALYLGDVETAKRLYTDLKHQRAQNSPDLHRRYTLTLKLGADTYAEIGVALGQIQFDLLTQVRDQEELEQDYNSVTGSPSAGWSIDIKFDPEMTHERYFELLNEYLEEKRGA